MKVPGAAVKPPPADAGKPHLLRHQTSLPGLCRYNDKDFHARGGKKDVPVYISL